MKKTETKQTQIDKVLDLISKYLDTTGAILDDYLADDGMVTELAAADENLREAVEDLRPEDVEEEIKQIIARLKELELDQEQSEEIIEFLDKDALWDWSKNLGYAYVKIDSIEKADKLEEFIKAEIWPHYNERDNYSI